MLDLIIKKINKFVVIGAIVVCSFLLLIWTLFSWIFAPKVEPDFQPTAIFRVIQAPTITSSPIPSLTPDIAATQKALEETGGIYIGGFVEISGTNGAGLRLRAGPGLDHPLLFLGYDSEVFKVRDGPKESDGIIWWYLVAPYDEARSGWAASDYIAPVTSDN